MLPMIETFYFISVLAVECDSVWIIIRQWGTWCSIEYNEMHFVVFVLWPPSGHIKIKIKYYHSLAYISMYKCKFKVLVKNNNATCHLRSATQIWFWWLFTTNFTFFENYVSIILIICLIYALSHLVIKLFLWNQVFNCWLNKNMLKMIDKILNV